MSFWNSKETPEQYEERRQRNAERAREREEREQIQNYNRFKIQELRLEVESIINGSDFYTKNRGEEVRAIQQQLHEFKMVGRDYIHLIDEFRKTIDAFWEKRRAHFELRKSQMADNAIVMSELVRDAERISDSPENFKQAKSALDEIREKMKYLKVDKENGDYYWSRYKEIRALFNDKYSKFIGKS